MHSKAMRRILRAILVRADHDIEAEDIGQFDVLAALSGLELVLLEMGYNVEPGSGVAAAQRVLAQSVSQVAV